MFLSRRRLNLTRLCEVLTPTVPLKQGVSGVYTLYFLDVCAMISSPHPRRVPVELPNGTVEYVFLQPYLSALYIHFRREVKHEPIWFCEGLPFHERPFFATKIRELCNLYPILLATTSAELDTQASFISVQWLVIRSSIDTHMLDFMLASQGSCVCDYNVGDVSYPVPTVRPSAYRDADVVTYTRHTLSAEPSASMETVFTVDPGASITPHTSQLITYQNSLSEFHESTASDCNYSTLRQNKNYSDPIDILDEAITQGKQIHCCHHCGFPILSGSVSSGRGMTSFLTSFNFRYAPPGASLTHSNTLDSCLLSRLIDSPTVSTRSLVKGTNASIFKVDDFNSIFAETVFINSLQAMLPPPLTLLLDTRAELAEFDASAVIPDNSTVVTINKLQQKSYLSRRSREMINHRKSNSGISVSHHIRKASTMVSLSNNVSLHAHQGTESFTNISIEEDVAQSPHNLSYSETSPLRTVLADTKLEHPRGVTEELHERQGHTKNVLKQGVIEQQVPDSRIKNKKPDEFSKSAKMVGVNPFTQQWLEPNRNTSAMRSQRHKTPLKINSYTDQTVMINSADIIRNSIQTPSSLPANVKKNVPRSTSVESKDSLISGISSEICVAARPSTDSKLSQAKVVNIVIKDTTNDNSLLQDSQADSIVHNENQNSFLAFTSDRTQETSTSTSSSIKRTTRIRRKVDLNTYVPVTAPAKIEPVVINLSKMDTSPIRPRSPAHSTSNDEPSQDSIIHDTQQTEPIGGDSCSMSGLEDSDEAMSPSNLNSANTKKAKNQTNGQDCHELSKTSSTGVAAPFGTAPRVSMEPRAVATASLNILTALRAYHVVTTKKQAIKSKLRNIGPNILEPGLASQLYKSSHYTHLVFRWFLLNEDFVHYSESHRKQRRITKLSPICDDYRQIKDLLGFYNMTMYLVSMLIRDILNCTSLLDKSTKGKVPLHKSKVSSLRSTDVDPETAVGDLIAPNAPSAPAPTDIGLTMFVISGFKKLFASIAKLSDLFKHHSSDDSTSNSPDTEVSSIIADKPISLPQARKPSQKCKKKVVIQTSVKLLEPPPYYGLYDLRRIVSQICRYLYRKADARAPDPYTLITELYPSVFKTLSTQQQTYLSYNLQRNNAVSLQHTPAALFTDLEPDVQQDIDACIDAWLNSGQSQKSVTLNSDIRSYDNTFEPIVYDNNYDINTNIPVLAIYHSFNSVFWSSVIRSNHLKGYLLPHNQLFRTIITANIPNKYANPVIIDSLGATVASSTHDLGSTNDSSTMDSYTINSPLDIWKSSQVSDKTDHDPSDVSIANAASRRSTFHRPQPLKTTDDGNLSVRQQSQQELRDLLIKGAAYTGQSTPALGSTDSSTYTTASAASNSLFLSSPVLTDLPLYKFLVPDESAGLDLSYKAFGAGLIDERLILNTYFYTNRFFIPQPNRLALFNILTVSGGLFMSRDERLSMETVMRETLACLHLTYYDLDYYYYT